MSADISKSSLTLRREISVLLISKTCQKILVEHKEIELVQPSLDQKQRAWKWPRRMGGILTTLNDMSRYLVAIW